MIKAVALFSGGKDSVYSTYIAQQQFFDVVFTLTLIPADTDSHMFHVPNANLAGTVSSAMGIPNRSVSLRQGENELDALSNALMDLGTEAIITGALASDYQAFRINMVCEPLGIRVFSPLWHKNQKRLLREMVEAGFRLVMVGVSAEGLDYTWLGREIDSKAMDDLSRISEKTGIQYAGEGGEFETIVLDGPNFNRSLEIVSAKSRWGRSSGTLKINAMRLHNKQSQ
ncbi:MAG: diphthine--ammonia ligase [Thermoplasmata archaeon]|nr:diphthine--ammonia ligase [Thermoplasmata archaeon]